MLLLKSHNIVSTDSEQQEGWSRLYCWSLHGIRLILQWSISLASHFSVTLYTMIKNLWLFLCALLQPHPLPSVSYAFLPLGTTDFAQWNCVWVLWDVELGHFQHKNISGVSRSVLCLGFSEIQIFQNKFHNLLATKKYALGYLVEKMWAIYLIVWERAKSTSET